MVASVEQSRSRVLVYGAVDVTRGCQEAWDEGPGRAATGHLGSMSWGLPVVLMVVSTSWAGLRRLGIRPCPMSAGTAVVLSDRDEQLRKLGQLVDGVLVPTCDDQV